MDQFKPTAIDPLHKSMIRRRQEQLNQSSTPAPNLFLPVGQPKGVSATRRSMLNESMDGEAPPTTARPKMFLIQGSKASRKEPLKYKVKEMYQRVQEPEKKDFGNSVMPRIQMETLQIVDEDYRSLQALQGRSFTERGRAPALIGRFGNDSKPQEQSRSPLELLRAYASTGKKVFTRLQKSSSETKLLDHSQFPAISKFSRNERVAIPNNLLRSVAHAELQNRDKRSLDGFSHQYKTVSAVKIQQKLQTPKYELKINKQDIQSMEREMMLKIGSKRSENQELVDRQKGHKYFASKHVDVQNNIQMFNTQSRSKGHASLRIETSHSIAQAEPTAMSTSKQRQDVSYLNYTNTSSEDNGASLGSGPRTQRQRPNLLDSNDTKNNIRIRSTASQHDKDNSQSAVGANNTKLERVAATLKNSKALIGNLPTFSELAALNKAVQHYEQSEDHLEQFIEKLRGELDSHQAQQQSFGDFVASKQKGSQKAPASRRRIVQLLEDLGANGSQVLDIGPEPLKRKELINSFPPKLRSELASKLVAAGAGSPRRDLQIEKANTRKYRQSSFDQSQRKPNYDQVMEQIHEELTQEMRQKQLEINKQARSYAADVPNQKSNLGLPSSRQDAIILQNWYFKMLAKITKSHNPITVEDQDSNLTKASSNEMYKSIASLYELTINVAIKEICRQVSVQCIERGALLKILFDQFFELLNQQASIQKKCTEDSRIKFVGRVQTLQQEILKHQEADKRQAEDEKLEKKLLESRVDVARAEVRVLNNEISKIKKQNHKMFNENFDRQQFNLILERENEILKTKLKEFADVGDLLPDRVVLLRLVEQQQLHKKNKEARLTGRRASQAATAREEKEIILRDFEEKEDATSMTGFFEHIEATYGQQRYEKGTQIELEMKNKKSQCDKHKLGMMVEKGVSVNVRGPTNAQVTIKKKKRSKYRFTRSLDVLMPSTKNQRTGQIAVRSKEHQKIQEEVTLIQEDETQRPRSARKENIEEIKPTSTETLESFIQKFPALRKQIAENLEEIRESHCEAPAHGKLMTDTHGQISVELLDTLDGILKMLKEKQEQMETLQETQAQQRRRRQTMRNDNLELARFMLLEEIDKLKMLNESEKKYVDQLKKDLDGIERGKGDEQKLIEITNIVNELKDQITESGVVVNDMSNASIIRGERGGIGARRQRQGHSAEGDDSDESEDGTSSAVRGLKAKLRLKMQRGINKISTGNYQGVSKERALIYRLLTKARQMKPEKLQPSSMPKMMLSKFINQIYLDVFMNKKNQKITINYENNIDMLAIVFEFINNRYGTQISEKKLQQFICGIYCYKGTSSRIRLFGRFAGFFDENLQEDGMELPKDGGHEYSRIGEEHLKKYFMMLDYFQQNLLGFKCTENDSQIYLPLAKAQQFFKQALDFKAQTFKQFEKVLIRNKVLMSREELMVHKHLRIYDSPKVIDLDWFYEFLCRCMDQQAQNNPKDSSPVKRNDTTPNEVIDFQEFKVHLEPQAIRDLTDEAIQELYNSTYSTKPPAAQIIQASKRASAKLPKSEYATPTRKTEDFFNPGHGDYALAVPQDAHMARSRTIRSTGQPRLLFGQKSSSRTPVSSEERPPSQIKNSAQSARGGVTNT